MGVNTTGLLNTQTEVYASYKNDAVTKNETAAKKDSTAKTEEKNESGVVYDKSDSSKDNKKATYSINKMSAEDRAALVQQMKADTQSRQQQLISIVQKMMTGQAATSSVANGTNSDDIWKFLAKGDFTVDAATKAQAQKDISEDGYYGVKQTSERLFDFASALAGDDVEKMKKMQTAISDFSGEIIATITGSGIRHLSRRNGRKLHRRGRNLLCLLYETYFRAVERRKPRLAERAA